ncbi:MAG: hypothetical protein KIT22_09565 [Verrucomicrobiae bacterium]|nr:hypothetical protein [Verrucomicrobiae bacterium]
MNITKDIITDLYPLYAENECSADTRALVEAYLQRHPQLAEELRRVTSAPLPDSAPRPRDLGETRSLREARRRIRLRSWWMALAIFFSLAPFSFAFDGGYSWWMLRDATGAAMVYAVLGVVFWILYGLERRRSDSL